MLQLAHLGRLSGTGCLVDGPSFLQNAPRLRASGLQAGLHLNFTEQLEHEGIFMPLGRLVQACWTRRLDAAQVRRQIATQLDRYESVMQRAPDYVDGHQHVHQFPQIREALLVELARRYPAGSRPWLRSTLASGRGLPAGTKVKAAIIATLGAAQTVRLARRQGLQLNRALLGVYDFQGGAAGYSDLLRRWLSIARDNDLIMCHPATAAVPGDPLGRQRLAELEVLASDETGEWLRRHDVVISRSLVSDE